jgi:hypothetical protein
MPSGQSIPSVPYQIIAGPADVFVAPVGTAFPAINTASSTNSPPAGWTALGKTQGGVSVKHSQTVEQITSDQTTGPIKAVRSSESLDITFALIELTIATIAYIMNQQTVNVVTGPPHDQDIPIHRGRSVARNALLVRGDSPYGNFFMQYEVPVVVMTDAPQMDFAENKVAMMQCTFTALEDLTQASEANRFGTLRAQDQ